MSDKESSAVWNKSELYQWEGFWSNLTIIKEAKIFKATFKLDPNDVGPGGGDGDWGESVEGGGWWMRVGATQAHY
ncbi:hypothetical protein KY289_026742 [Solanum tuberosum]|nr:hypothetical protein KY289_026742 [Solanum tuberosum]